MIRPAQTPALPLLLVSALLFSILGWFFSYPITAKYEDLVLEKAYYEDSIGNVTIDSVAQRPFTPFMGPLFRGNNFDPLWLKLTIAPSAQRDWVVVVQPNHTHHADIYLPDGQGGWSVKQVGTSHAFNDREVKTMALAVKFQPDPTQVTVVYVRVKTPTTPIFARVISQQDNAQSNSNIQLIASAFLGMGFFMVMVSLLIFMATKETLWLTDSIYNLTGLWVFALLLGFVSQFVLPNAENLVNQLVVLGSLAYVVITNVLYYRIFKLFVVPSWLLWHAYFIWSTLPFTVTLALIGYPQYALAINNSLILFSNFFGVLIAIKARHQDVYLLYAFRFAYLVLTLFTVWWILPIIFQEQTENYSALYPNFLVAMFSLFMLMVVLLRNTQLKLQESLRIEIEKRQVEYELDVARQRHEKSSSFYAMLMHEVKTPLSTIRMAVSNLEVALVDQDESVIQRLKRVQNSVDSVDDVLKRGVDVDILEQGALAPNFVLIDVSTLVKEGCEAYPARQRLQFSCEAPLKVRTDSQLLTLMLGNLLDNAVKYSRANTPILVELREESQLRWQLSVRSKVGPVGFPDETKLFAKYYRAELAISKSGMGLGLYWVRGVARRMGGDASYQRDGDWVVFSIHLPTSQVSE